MRRPFYRKPTNTVSSGTVQINSLQTLRERIFNAMLIGGVLVGAIAVIFNLISDVPQGNWGLIIVYVLAYGWILIDAFVKRLPFRARVLGFLVVPFILGIAASLQDGIAGNGRVWFVGFSALSSILLGLNGGIIALGISTATLLIIGGMITSGVIAMPSPETVPSSIVFMDWTSTGAVFLLITIIIVISLVVLVNGLNTSLEKETSMAQELAGDREKLNQQTHELDRRLVQIRTAAEISRSIGALLDPNTLLQQVVELMRERFDLYYVGVFLLDENREYLLLRAATGDAGKQMVAEGYKLSVGGTSMVGWTVANRRPRISLDVGGDAVRFNNPLLPQTRSEMALPLLSGEQVFGSITVQSSHPRAFDEDDITVVQGIVDSLAIALQNARLFQQEKKNLEEIQALNRQYLVNTWTRVVSTQKQTSYTFVNEQVMKPAKAGAKQEQPSVVKVPLSLRDQTIGQITLETGEGSLSPEDASFVAQVTTQAALALENARLLEETQARAMREQAVNLISTQIRGSANLDSILQNTVRELGRVLGGPRTFIQLGLEQVDGTGGMADPTEGAMNASEKKNDLL
jgi:GAF domain-containing protein